MSSVRTKAPGRAGRGRMGGTTSGTPTMPSRRLSPSRSRAAAYRVLFFRWGKGWLGSMIWGISNGRMASRYQARTYSRSPFFSSL